MSYPKGCPGGAHKRTGPGLGAAILGVLAAGWVGAAGAANRFAVNSGNWTSTAVWSAASCAGASGASVPGNNDDVTICTGRTVTLNTSTNNLGSLTVQGGAVLQGNGAGAVLTVGRGGGLDVSNSGTINFSGATSATLSLGRDSQWSGAGAWNLSIISLNTRTLSFPAGTVMTLNLSGATPITHTPGNGAIVNPAPPGLITWNFNGVVPQSLPARAEVQFGNLRINNPSATGVTMGVGLSAALGNLSGSLLIQGGTLTDGGFAVAGAAAQTFQISPGTTFRVTGASNQVSGFGTIDYGTAGACGTVDYAGAAQTVSGTSPNYGNLRLSGSGVKTMPGTPLAVACDFTMSGTATAAAAGAITVGRHFTLDAGTSFTAGGFTHSVGGNFSNAGTFTAGSSTFVFNGTVAQAIAAPAATAFRNLSLSNSAAAVTASSAFSVNGTLGIGGGAALADGGNTITVAGNVSNAGIHSGAGRILLSGGAAAHGLSGAGTLGNLELDDALGATLGSSVTVAGTVSLTNGVIGTGSANTLVTTADCNASSVLRALGYVDGRLQKRIPAGASVCTFEIGSGGSYTPVVTDFAAGTTAGSLLGYVTAPDHPDIAGAGLDAAKSVNRYWTLAAPVTGALPAGTYAAAFNFVAGDVDPGANTALFEVKRFQPPYPGAGLWSATTAGTRGATSTQAVGLSAFGDFAVGEPASTKFSRERELIYTRELY